MSRSYNADGTYSDSKTIEKFYTGPTILKFDGLQCTNSSECLSNRCDTTTKKCLKSEYNSPCYSNDNCVGSNKRYSLIGDPYKLCNQNSDQLPIPNMKGLRIVNDPPYDPIYRCGVTKNSNNVSACYTDADCESGKCFNGFCKGRPNDYCTTNSECISNTCDTTTNRCGYSILLTAQNSESGLCYSTNPSINQQNANSQCKSDWISSNTGPGYCSIPNLANNTNNHNPTNQCLAGAGQICNSLNNLGTNCLSNRCNNVGSAKGMCLTGADGSRCLVDADCNSNSCNKSPPDPITGIGKCNKSDLNRKCYQNSECKNPNNICINSICKSIVGGDCTTNSDCTSNTCDTTTINIITGKKNNKCVSNPNINGNCLYSNDCLTQNCTKRKCAKGNSGNSCNKSADCTTNICISNNVGDGDANTLGAGSGTCGISSVKGGCSINGDCYSGSCNTTTTPRKCNKGADNKPCQINKDCTSNYCLFDVQTSSPIGICKPKPIDITGTYSTCISRSAVLTPTTLITDITCNTSNTTNVGWERLSTGNFTVS